MLSVPASSTCSSATSSRWGVVERIGLGAFAEEYLHVEHGEPGVHPVQRGATCEHVGDQRQHALGFGDPVERVLGTSFVDDVENADSIDNIAGQRQVVSWMLAGITRDRPRSSD